MGLLNENKQLFFDVEKMTKFRKTATLMMKPAINNVEKKIEIPPHCECLWRGEKINKMENLKFEIENPCNKLV